MSYAPLPNRYDKMLFNRCGKSGLKLPAISLGLWHNFGFGKSPDSKSAICRRRSLGATKNTSAAGFSPAIRLRPSSMQRGLLGTASATTISCS